MQNNKEDYRIKLNRYNIVAGPQRVANRGQELEGHVKDAPLDESDNKSCSVSRFLAQAFKNEGK